MDTLRDTVERLSALEAEKKNLLLEMEELKKLSESKTTALESEVSMLREEIDSLKKLLGVKEELSEEPRKAERTREKGKSKSNPKQKNAFQS